jgi:hypothetical protein
MGENLTIPYLEALRTIYEADVRVMQEATRKAKASRAALYEAVESVERFRESIRRAEQRRISREEVCPKCKGPAWGIAWCANQPCPLGYKSYDEG